MALFWLFLFFNLKMLKIWLFVRVICLSLPKISVKQVIYIMKQLHFYALGECGEKKEKKYLRDWVNWTGEVPMTGDCVLIHFGDYNEEEYKYRVVGRVLNGSKPDDIDIIVSLAEF